MLMGYLDDILYGIDSTQHIAHMSDADEFGTRGDVSCNIIAAHQTAIVGDGQMLHHDTQALSLQLPRNDIRVVLHLGYEHLVTSLHLTLAERASHQVDGLGSATRKDYLFYLLRIDKLAYLLTSSLMQVGSLLRQIMHATMHIGINVKILVAHSIEHTQGFLCGCRIVQINQWLTIHLTAQYREIFSYLIDIVHSYLQSLQPSHLFSSPRKRFSTR